MIDVKKTMRIGVMGPFYPIPQEIENNKKGEWLIKRTAKLGCGCLHLCGNVFIDDLNVIEQLAETSKQYDMELEIPAPQEIFTLTGSSKHEGKEALIKTIKYMKILETKIMRTGYGKLNIATSRFNKDFPINEHMKFVADNLKEAAKIAEDNDVYIAIENHCDFKGTQMAEIFDMVDSSHVGCALDTANGYTVFCDPDDDVKVLARYAITTHMKDMVMLRDSGFRIPFYPVGCAVGEGSVNIPAAIDIISKECPHPEGLHLIIETGWIKYEEGWDKAQKDTYMNEMYSKSIAYLKSQL